MVTKSVQTPREKNSGHNPRTRLGGPVCGWGSCLERVGGPDGQAVLARAGRPQRLCLHIPLNSFKFSLNLFKLGMIPSRFEARRAHAVSRVDSNIFVLRGSLQSTVVTVESKGQNHASTVLHLPHFLDSGVASASDGVRLTPFTFRVNLAVAVEILRILPSF